MQPKMPKGTPYFSDEWRAAQMNRAKEVLEGLFEFGPQEAHWIARCMFQGLYVTAMLSGISPNQVLSEFDFHTQEIRNRLVMFGSGELKSGDLGPR